MVQRKFKEDFEGTDKRISKKPVKDDIEETDEK